MKRVIAGSDRGHDKCDASSNDVAPHKSSQGDTDMLRVTIRLMFEGDCR